MAEPVIARHVVAQVRAGWAAAGWRVFLSDQGRWWATTTRRPVVVPESFWEPRHTVLCPDAVTAGEYLWLAAELERISTQGKPAPKDGSSCSQSADRTAYRCTRSRHSMIVSASCRSRRGTRLVTEAGMTNPKRPGRKLLWVSENAHAAVSSMQDLLTKQLGYKVYQSETVMRGMEALQREQEAER